MPLYEYKCNDCNKIFEVFHKSSVNLEKVQCPECKSEDYKKLLSAFAPSVKGEPAMTFTDPMCSNGGCSMNDNGHCCNH